MTANCDTALSNPKRCLKQDRNTQLTDLMECRQGIKISKLGMVSRGSQILDVNNQDAGIEPQQAEVRIRCTQFRVFWKVRSGIS